MKIAAKLAMWMIAMGLTAALAGCENSPDQTQPDLDKTISGEHGLQSRNLREMTDRMAPDLLQIPQISGNPNRIIVVMTPVVNKLVTNPGEDLTIYVARLKVLLNSSATRDRIAFMLDPAELEKVRVSAGAGGGNGDLFEQASRLPPQPGGGQLVPQYALGGVFMEMRNTKTSYYLCTFQLTDLNTGIQVWEKGYEVRSLMVD